MNVGTFFGFKCPRCNSKTTVTVSFGQNTPTCPQCKTEMIPDPEGQSVAMNVYCPHCRATYGMVLSDRCPTCGGPFSKIP